MRARRVKKLDPAEPLADNAARIIRVRLDELRSFASRALEADRIRDQHDMRIAAKRLRYVLELTGAQATVKQLKRLQDLHAIADLLSFACRQYSTEVSTTCDRRRQAASGRASTLSSSIATAWRTQSGNHKLRCAESGKSWQPLVRPEGLGVRRAVTSGEASRAGSVVTGESCRWRRCRGR